MTRTQTGTPVCVGGACCPTCQPPRAAARTKCMELLSLMRMRACRLLSRANTRVSRMRRQRFEERAQAAQNAAGRRLLELMARKRSNLAVAADVADPAALLRLADQVATPGSLDRVWFGLGPHLIPYVVLPSMHPPYNHKGRTLGRGACPCMRWCTRVSPATARSSKRGEAATTRRCTASGAAAEARRGMRQAARRAHARSVRCAHVPALACARPGSSCASTSFGKGIISVTSITGTTATGAWAPGRWARRCASSRRTLTS